MPTNTAIIKLPLSSDAPAGEFLTQRVGVLHKLLERQTARILLRDHQLTLAEWRVLAQLSARSPMTVRAMSEEMFVDRAEVSRAAASLIRRGHVERAGDPKDRRSAFFSCTRKGRALYAKIRPMRERFQSSLEKQLSRTELATLYKSLDALTTHLRRDED